MQIGLLIAGSALIIVGAVWIGQGTGYFPYPASSLKIDDSRWAYSGGVTLVLGLLLLAFARRK